jgi:CheY-like chemotaxis protein
MNDLDNTVILVVDDDPDIRTVLVDLLQLNGYSVCAAGNGAEALTCLETSSPDLIILDLWMPVLNGAGLVRELDRRGIDLPILITTAAPNPGQIASDLGAIGCLQKPFELIDLLDAVERACQTPRTNRAERLNGLPSNRRPWRDLQMPSLPRDAIQHDASGG